MRGGGADLPLRRGEEGAVAGVPVTELRVLGVEVVLRVGVIVEGGHLGGGGGGGGRREEEGEHLGGGGGDGGRRGEEEEMETLS